MWSDTKIEEFVDDFLFWNVNSKLDKNSKYYKELRAKTIRDTRNRLIEIEQATGQVT